MKTKKISFFEVFFYVLGVSIPVLLIKVGDSPNPWSLIIVVMFLISVSALCFGAGMQLGNRRGYMFLLKHVATPINAVLVISAFIQGIINL